MSIETNSLTFFIRQVDKKTAISSKIAWLKISNYMAISKIVFAALPH